MECIQQEWYYQNQAKHPSEFLGSPKILPLSAPKDEWTKEGDEIDHGEEFKPEDQEK